MLESTTARRKAMCRGTVIVAVLLASVSLAFTGREDMREEL